MARALSRILWHCRWIGAPRYSVSLCAEVETAMIRKFRLGAEFLADSAELSIIGVPIVFAIALLCRCSPPVSSLVTAIGSGSFDQRALGLFVWPRAFLLLQFAVFCLQHRDPQGQSTLHCGDGKPLCSSVRAL